MSTEPDEVDEVDEVVAAWRRERPDLAVDSMEVWSRIHRLASILDEHRKRVFGSAGVEAWEFDVLAALRRAGGSHQLSPGQLIAMTHVTSGTMTNRIDRLRKRGLVVREADPHDGRAALVTLTDAGQEVVDAALANLLDSEERMLDGWSDQDRSGLADLLRRLTIDTGRP